MLLIMKWTSGTFSLFSTFERIAKKILLAQINANCSSSDDISSDEESLEDESESAGDQEVREGSEENTTDENGEFFIFVFNSTLTLPKFLKAQVGDLHAIYENQWSFWLCTLL